MDLHWQATRMREWIGVGEREGLTFRELSRRSGLGERSLRRWCAVLRKRGMREPFKLEERPVPELIEPPSKADSADTPRPARKRAFVELADPASPRDNQIQIVLTGNRRIVIDGAVDVEALVRVIAAVERC